MTAYLLKLINGDEIITNVDYESITNELFIEIIDPLIIESKPNTNGAIAFVLNKYLPFSKENKIILNTSHVISIAKISEDMEKYWKANIEYINNIMVPIMENNIKRGLQYFTVHNNLESDIEEEIESSEISEEEFMEELLKELEPPSKLKH